MARYVSQLDYIRERVFSDRRPENAAFRKSLPAFYAAWSNALSRVCKDQRNAGMDKRLYDAEKFFFGIIWPDEIFPGVNPSSTSRRRTILNGLGSQIVEPAVPLPAPIMETELLARSSSSSRNPGEPFHAARHTFLFSITEHGSLPAPLARTLGCKITSEVDWARGGLRISLQPLPNCEGRWKGELKERAHKIVEEWSKMTVDEGWEQMIRVLGSESLNGGRK